MVQTEDLLNRLRKRPFEPFRVVLKDGRRYDIRFPELNMVGKVTMSIGIPEPNNPDPYPERIVDVYLQDIQNVEILPDDPAAIKWQPAF